MLNNVGGFEYTMRVKEGSFTIILVGHWNKYILTPDWIGKNIFKDDQIGVEVAFNIALPNRYISQKNNVILVPTSNNVTLVSLKPEDQCLENVETFAHELVLLLPATPVQAYGFNFGYTEKINDDLMKMFDFNDDGWFKEQEIATTHKSIHRRIIVEDTAVNLRISHDNESISFDFNYHYDVKSTEDIKKNIKGAALKNKGISEKVLKTVYKLDFDSVKEG